MSYCRPTLSWVAFVVAAIILATNPAPATAYIKVDTPFVAVYDQASEVYIARVKSVDADKSRAIVVIEKVLRQNKKDVTVEPPTDEIALQIDAPKELTKQLSPGSPVVAFIAGKGMMLHAADTWLQADQPTARVWRASGKHEITSAFPGRTAALVEVVTAARNGDRAATKTMDSFSAKRLKEIGNPLLDRFEHSNWSGKRYSLGKLGVKGTQMAAADVDGDKHPDVLITTADGLRFYRGAGAQKPVAEATKEMGLTDAKAARVAFGDADGDGKPDLLLDGALWLNTGKGFALAKGAIARTDTAAPLAVALLDATGDGKPDAVILSAFGKLEVFENSGRADAAWKAAKPRQLWEGGDAPHAAHFGLWGDDGKPRVLVIFPNDIVVHALAGNAPPADYSRLTGLKKLDRYFPIKDYAASAAIDFNGGDGRLDLVVGTKSGSPRNIHLMNRGYGAYWPNNEAGFPKGLGGKGNAPVALAAADMYGDGTWELLVLMPSGELVQLDSPAYKKGKPVE